ncbi:MAG: HEAT repeat domain-containing protein [Myxococcales bacterium]|nr:HEAT repeat domain-containing protein [Myxococcales bacterium]
MLRDSSSFRVRARAAMALGRSGQPSAAAALERALLDSHAAVRAAAATALGRVGSRRSVSALRVASSDKSPAVAEQAKLSLRRIAARESISRGAPSATASLSAAPSSERSDLRKVRYAVVLGEMRNQSGFQGSDLERFLAGRIAYELDRLEHVVVLSLGDMSGDIAAELKRRRVPIFRIEGSVKTVERGREGTQMSVRTTVSMLLMDEPSRTLRSMLSGAATGLERPTGAAASQERLLARKAMTSAVRSALSKASEAIEAAAVKRDLGMSDIRAEASLDKKLTSGRARP